jgi:hypothetical protein
MPDNPNESGQNIAKVISETVAFQYSNEAGLQFIGEAELVIEILGNQADAGTNLYSVRVDILSLYDSEGGDVFAQAINDRILKSALEKTALNHYFHPPMTPVGLPKRAEW